MQVRESVPASRAMMRACLAPLHAWACATQQEQLAHVEAQIAQRASALDEIGQERSAFKQDHKAFVLYDECAAFINYLDDYGLLGLRGARTPIGYYERHWPGQVKPSLVQFKKYLRISRFLPEDAVKSGHASVSLLDDVAQVENRSVIRLLCERIGPRLHAQSFRDSVQAFGHAARWGVPTRKLVTWFLRDEKADGLISVLKQPDFMLTLKAVAKIRPDFVPLLLEKMIKAENGREYEEEIAALSQETEAEYQARCAQIDFLYQRALAKLDAQERAAAQGGGASGR